MKLGFMPSSCFLEENVFGADGKGKHACSEEEELPFFRLSIFVDIPPVSWRALP